MTRLPFMAIVVVAGLACSKSDAPRPEAPAKVEVGGAAPAYSAISLAGDSVSLEAMKGKVVLMNVWATWCGPCRQEIPELRALNERYKPRGLELVGITDDAEGSDAAIRQFLKDFKMDYAIWRDPDERVSTKFLMAGVPATFLIDKAGIIRWKTTGPIDPADKTLAEAIERALLP